MKIKSCYKSKVDLATNILERISHRLKAYLIYAKYEISLFRPFAEIKVGRSGCSVIAFKRLICKELINLGGTTSHFVLADEMARVYLYKERKIL